MNQGETKTDATGAPNAENDSILAYLSTRLLYPVAAGDTPPYEPIAWWKIIFSYLGIKKRAQLELRWMCRIFRDALPCLPLWTSFPHPLYPTLIGLMGRLNHLGNHFVNLKAADISIGLKVYLDHGVVYVDHTITKINPDGTYNITGNPHYPHDHVALSKLKQKVIHICPSLMFIADGVHDEGGEVLDISIPISIIGESREHCIVVGGLQMMGGKQEDDVNVQDLTLRKSKEGGVGGIGGASIHLDNVSVENSEKCGVFVLGSKRNTMKNCNVSHSKGCGLYVCHDGMMGTTTTRSLMTISGNATSIHHNGTDGSSFSYGLHTNLTASIHLASSLTIETIVTNNGGGGDYGGDGIIAIVDNEGTIIEIIQEPAEYESEDGSEEGSEYDSEDDSEGEDY